MAFCPFCFSRSGSPRRSWPGGLRFPRRTIQRDIDALCRAGIPLVTTQGAGGGISIMEGYRVDRTLLTTPEMQAILAGLRSLDTVSYTHLTLPTT